MYVTDAFTAKFYFGEDAGQYTGSTIPVLYCTGQFLDRWNVLCEHKSLLDYPKLIVDEHFKLTLSF